MIQLMLIGLLASSAAAGPSDAPALSPASEVETPAADAAQQALDDLHHLYLSRDWQGLRTSGLLAAYRLDLPEAAYFAAIGRWKSGDPSGAHLDLSSLGATWAGTPLGQASSLAAGDVMVDLAPSLAAQHYQRYIAGAESGAWDTHATAGLSLSLAKQGRFPEAHALLIENGLPPPEPLAAVVNTPPRWRQPGVARALAIVPGAGHLYAGAPGQALSSFLVNGLFIGGVAAAAHFDRWESVAVLGFFGLGFYGGNIYGAGEAALRANRVHRDRVERSFRTSGLVEKAPPLPTTRWVEPAANQAAPPPQRDDDAQQRTGPPSGSPVSR